MSDPVIPIGAIRAAFTDCEQALAKAAETGKASDTRAWKRKGTVLEVVCVGHMRACLDYIERLEADRFSLIVALGQLIPGNIALNNPAWDDSTVIPVDVTLGEIRAAQIAIDKATGAA